MIDVKNFVNTLEGKPVAVLGLGISNIAAVRALVKAGASVTVWDDKEENRAAVDAPARDLAEDDLSAYACLVLAPGIPHDHPAVLKAKAADIEILCDIEILHRCGHGRKTIGITGTNGKSTTTALIGHILNENGIKAAVGGNIGKPVLGLSMPPKDGVIVMEMSSFQLELCPAFAPDIAVHLNLTPDHLDRHGSMEAYAEAKMRIFRGPGKAVIGTDDDWSKKIFKTVEESGERECFPITTTGAQKDGVYVEEGFMYEAMYGDPVEITEMTMTALPGVHNHQNAAAAYAAARLMGLEPDAIIAAMESFPGLMHRQYLVRTINGVAYVNDSKATNAAAAGRALASYKNIYWILGGRPKDGGLKGLEPYVDHIRHAFLIGEAMDDFATWLDNHGVSHNFCTTLDIATAEAHRLAQGDRGQPGGTGMVLLSPACASFDQFKSFEERGDRFTALVNDLKEDAA
ncbi:MAG: UDP-N-acetylmuramoyl-L-alanine--D-glutamate ligase [Rhodospirillales bacterium]|nr:UDP-N-acetylmuramoyl-L-alanine--D-glutamate ligase [Rhodospirillales bacterium]MCB9996697.1 UDP-N-acetylmuramoyl-L-alanine--D-glutamate ligase [Rhodospirillales bacterium]